MTAATFDVIADVTFSGDSALDRGSIHAAIETYISKAARISLLDVIGVPDWVPRPGRVALTRTLDATRRAADAAIEARAVRGPSAPPDLMQAGVDPKDGRRMTTAELRDNLLTFIVAGHETTALTLAWAMYLCAFDQEVQDRARVEVQSALAGRRAACAEVVPHLPYIRRIIDEALRLYPPGGMISRIAQVRDRLCGADVRPGDTVIIPIYALHRNAGLWQDPDAFRPDRFETKPDRYAYLPFDDGPRICIGASFALQEAVISLATLLANHRYAPVKGRNPDPMMILTPRPEGGVWLTAEPV